MGDQGFVGEVGGAEVQVCKMPGLCEGAGNVVENVGGENRLDYFVVVPVRIVHVEGVRYQLHDVGTDQLLCCGASGGKVCNCSRSAIPVPTRGMRCTICFHLRP